VKQSFIQLLLNSVKVN